MAVLVLTDATIAINSVGLADRATSVTINYEKDSVEVTSFGSGGHTFTGGLQNNSVEIVLNQDFATSNVEATIYPLVGTTTTLVIKASSAVTSATNPTYTISNAYLASHTPINGAVGELTTTSLTFTGGTIVKS